MTVLATTPSQTLTKEELAAVWKEVYLKPKENKWFNRSIELFIPILSCWATLYSLKAASIATTTGLALSVFSMLDDQLNNPYSAKKNPELLAYTNKVVKRLLGENPDGDRDAVIREVCEVELQKRCVVYKKVTGSALDITLACCAVALARLSGCEPWCVVPSFIGGVWSGFAGGCSLKRALQYILTPS